MKYLHLYINPLHVCTLSILLIGGPDITDEGDLLKSISKRKNNLIKVRYSTVLCTGEPKSGKTKFCHLLMNKNTQQHSKGDYHTIFIRKQSGLNWTEITIDELNVLIAQINEVGANNIKSTTKPGAINPDEILDILILLDINVPTPTISLLQPAIVTFVTYKLRGQEDAVCAKSHKLIKELMSSKCFRKESKFDELKITDKFKSSGKAFYTAFIGTLLDSDGNSELQYSKEAAMVNEKVRNLKSHVNCTKREMPLSIWFVKEGSDTHYLYPVDLNSTKSSNVSSIQKTLEDTVSQNLIHQVPITWILFSFKVLKLCYKQSEQFVHYKTVYETIWKNECKIDSEVELRLALKFFHHHGVLFHFHTVEGVKDFVFTRCCWMFDKLKEILMSLKDKERNYDAIEYLMKDGILHPDMIREVEFRGPDKMTFEAFMNLLRHLKFIAPLEGNQYFMPSVLDSYEHNTKVFSEYGNRCHDALFITFSSGSLHRSVFCFLSAYILTHKPKEWSQLFYDELTEQRYTFKDMITISIGTDYYICLIDKIFSLEVQIYSKAQQCDSNLHTTVYKFLEKAMKDVCISVEVPPEECKYGFLCSKCKLQDHVMILKDFTNNQAHCSKTNHPLRLSDNQTVWLEVCMHHIVQ